ncbi:MAG: nitroreductase [Dehalococcoidales bacterium]|jgi:nitroreductase
MDVIEAIKARKSIRAFKPDPVPLDLLKKIMEAALRAPSWANTQPWEFAVATGKKLKMIQDGFIKTGMQDPQSEVARPYEFPEPYMGRIRALQPKDRKEMTREEMEARFLDNFRHYGAPVCIYLLVGRNFVYQAKGVNVWSLYDCGSVVQNIMLLATSYGLGTIAQAQAVVYPDIIRKELGIPADKLIALGIAIGYEDKKNPVNKEHRDREPLDKIATFHGF